MKIGGLLKNVVGAVAPTLGTALGGPMGGMAAKMISEVLGVPNTPKAIDKAIQEATPEQLLELKKAEQAFEIQMNGPLMGSEEREAAKTAASLMGQNNVWYPFVEMAGDEGMKGLPAGLRMNAYATHGGVSKKKFEMYSLAASIVGKCHFCVKAHYDTLKQEGYSVENLRDIGRIASVMNSVAKVLNS